MCMCNNSAIMVKKIYYGLKIWLKHNNSCCLIIIITYIALLISTKMNKSNKFEINITTPDGKKINIPIETATDTTSNFNGSDESEIKKIISEIRESKSKANREKSLTKNIDVLKNLKQITRYQTLHLGWGHSENNGKTYERVRKPAGGIRACRLEQDRKYSVQDIIQYAKELFINEESLRFAYSSSIEELDFKLGYLSGQIISDFLTIDGTPCDLWTYYKSRGLISYRDSLFFLTLKRSSLLHSITSTPSSHSTSLLTTDDDNIQVIYYDIKVSKYTDSISIYERDKQEIFSSLTNHGELSYQEFDPTDYGFKISRIMKDNNILLDIEVDSLNTRRFLFPSSHNFDDHSVLFDPTTLSGTCGGEFGIGVIPSCNDTCVPVITWYKDGQIIKTGEFLYWLFTPLPGSYTWSVNCSESLKKLKENITECESSLQLSEKEVKQDCVEPNEDLMTTIPNIEKKDIQFSNRILGAGVQGLVKKGKWLGMTVAIKTIKIKNAKSMIAYREINVLGLIRHPYIVQLMGVCFEEKQFHIVMELVDGHTLSDILFDDDIKKIYNLTEQLKQKLIHQIAQSLYYLHGQKNPIIHRDIKPDNIMVTTTGYTVKLCDLGLSKFKIMTNVTKTMTGVLKGTPMYMAPEVLLDKKEATTSTDIWALGCTVIEIFFEDHAWQLFDETTENTLDEILKMKMTHKEIPPTLEHVPCPFRNIISQCFSYHPEERPAIADIVNTFSLGLIDE